MKRVEFLSYDGKYPCLCMGVLSIRVNGEIRFLQNVLYSGGYITNNYEDVVKGPWEVDLDDYPDLEPYKEEITDVINENIEHGCCGGCI